MNAAQKALLERRGGSDVGRDPRQVSREELIAAGHKPMSPLKALRLRCLDCCAGSAQEVRLCTAVACPAWSFRTGTNVWRAPASEARREWGRRLGKKTAAGAPKAFSKKAEINAPDGSAAHPTGRAVVTTKGRL